MTPITASQFNQIRKAVEYSFLAGFTGSLVIQSADLVAALHDGKAGLTRLGVSVITGGLVGGINGVAFAIEKLFTQEQPPVQ